MPGSNDGVELLGEGLDRVTGPGTKRFHHPVIGDVSFAYEVMELSADTGLTLTAYSPEPGSASHDSVSLLASWAATLDERPHDASSPHHRP